MGMASSARPILSTSFHYVGSRLAVGRARLYEDHVELSTWGWRRRHIPLGQIVAFEWVRSPDPFNFVLRLATGEVLRLVLEGPGAWKYALGARVALPMLTPPPLPPGEALLESRDDERSQAP